MEWKRMWQTLAVTAAGCLVASSAAAQTAGLKVQYRIPGAVPGDNHVRPHVNIVNTGTATVPLSELTVRYWYTVDGARPQVYTCDYTPRGCGNVTSSFVSVSPVRTGADTYLQLGFSAGMGSLAGGQSTGEIQGRFNKDNWTNYNEAGDYSYDPTKLAFADWDRVTLYRNGVLVWGVEPGGGGTTTQTLTVTRAGTGMGTVTSTPAGINCGATCSASFASGASVTLSQAAAAGATFAGWSGACTGTGACTVSMTQARAVTATFNTATTGQTLTVTRAGTGTGTVTSTPAGISCGTTCSASFTNGASVTLSQAAAAGSTFAGWSGACTGTGACTVAMTQARAVTATFNTATTGQTLTVTRAGTGTGTVTSTPAGINCGATCSASFANATSVSLTQAAAAGSTFAGWAGACTGTGACTVSMTQARAVTATFNTAAGQTLSVTRAGTGTGTVTSTPAGISCGTTCSASFTNGASVSLSQAAAAGSTFAGWSGACTGTAACTVSMTQARAVTATFNATTAVGRFRVDPAGRITKNGQIFPVRCGSWFGLEGRHEPSNDPGNPSGAPMEQYIGNTFWANNNQGTSRTVQQTMTEISQMGINVIRLPLVPQTLSTNDPQGTGNVLKNHPTVRVANSRLALEQLIVAADQAGIEVMLDVHSCSNYVGWRKGRLDARPPYVDATRDNYDFTRETYSCSPTGNPPGPMTVHPYNTTAWLNTLRTLAGLEQQLGVDNIIGIDIFNEPWDYTWQEWKSLTEQAYLAINAVNSNVLLFVQGISASAGNQDGTPTTIIQVPHGNPDTNPNWGENLFEAGPNPIAIPKERLVFSPHTYGPSVFVQKMFMDPTQPECTGLEGDEAGNNNCRIVINPTLLRGGWEEHFGYLRDQGYAVVVGEFGGNLDWPLGQASQRDRDRWSHITPGVDGQWQNAFVDYMVQNNIEGCYWSINPESGDTAGWYGHFYDPISNPAGWGQWRDFDERKTTLLRRLWGIN